ncbi:MAG: hypothetical protein IPF82_22815 [Blastocatellia bacterium]|nr:hypothetical protein [Blastocatellia bacterium]
MCRFVRRRDHEAERLLRHPRLVVACEGLGVRLSDLLPRLRETEVIRLQPRFVDARDDRFPNPVVVRLDLFAFPGLAYPDEVFRAQPRQDGVFVTLDLGGSRRYLERDWLPRDRGSFEQPPHGRGKRLDAKPDHAVELRASHAIAGIRVVYLQEGGAVALLSESGRALMTK